MSTRIALHDSTVRADNPGRRDRAHTSSRPAPCISLIALGHIEERGAHFESFSLDTASGRPHNAHGNPDAWVIMSLRTFRRRSALLRHRLSHEGGTADLVCVCANGSIER